MNIKRTLENLWHETRLPHAIIIEGEDIDTAFAIIRDFASDIFKPFTTVPIENNFDFQILDIDENLSSKTITIEQVRSKQQFLNQTAAITPYKFLVVKNAETMTTNASNSMLKFLEEPPQNCYIFLITNNATQLLPTINSRCMKLSLNIVAAASSESSYIEISNLFAANSIDKISEYCSQIALKSNSQKWGDFNKIVLDIYLQAIKKQNNINDKDAEIITSLAKLNPNLIIDSYAKTKIMLKQANEQDLDKKQIALLIFDKFKELNEC